jgi:HEAT repeat protein
VGCRVGKSTERLAKLLQDPAPWVRTAAADALADLPVLVESLKGQDEWVRLMAAEALDRMDGKARPALDAMKQVHAQDKREYVQRVLTKAIKDLEP